MTRPKPKPPAATPKPASVPFPNAVETGKEEVDRALQILLATQRERIAAVVSRSRDRSRGINMQLKMDGGNLAVKFTHESPDAAALILMADLATMDPAFYLGVTGQIARIGAHGAKVLDGQEQSSNRARNRDAACRVSQLKSSADLAVALYTRLAGSLP